MKPTRLAQNNLDNNNEAMCVNVDKDLLKELCERVDLVDYIAQSYDLKKSGAELVTLCPMHREKTPSLKVYPQEQTWYCYGCHRGGNIISWLMLVEHLTYSEAVDKICALTNTDIRNLKTCESLNFFKSLKNNFEQSIANRISDRKVLTEQDLCRFRPCNYNEPKEWLSEGITPEAIKKFDIRIDDAANRICYLQYDRNDRVIGVKGRTRYEAYKEMGLRKYTSYNKIGTVDFLQGMHENKKDILKANEIIIFEGIKSVLKVASWGYNNAVSAETSTLNKSQVDILIGLGIRNVVVGFDSDVPYKKITDNLKMLKRFVNVYVMYDFDNLLGGSTAKASPPDAGREVFERLYNGRRKI